MQQVILTIDKTSVMDVKFSSSIVGVEWTLTKLAKLEQDYSV